MMMSARSTTAAPTMTHVFHAAHVCGAVDDAGTGLAELDAGAHSCCDAAAHVTAGTRDSTVSTVSQLRQLYDTSLSRRVR